MLNKTTIVTLFIVQLTIFSTAHATLTQIQSPPGSELSVTDILNDYAPSLSLTRIDDGKDIIWGIGPDTSTSIRVIGKEAGFNNEFGFLSYANGAVSNFYSLNVFSNDIFGDPTTVITAKSFGDELLLAILTPQLNIFTSMPTQNTDSLDHMVTWVDNNDPFHYFVAFEDLLGGGDGDYNDIVLELNNFVDGAPIPNPPTLALLGVGLIGFAAFRRKVSQ